MGFVIEPKGASGRLYRLRSSTRALQPSSSSILRLYFFVFIRLVCCPELHEIDPVFDLLRDVRIVEIPEAEAQVRSNQEGQARSPCL